MTIENQIAIRQQWRALKAKRARIARLASEAKELSREIKYSLTRSPDGFIRLPNGNILRVLTVERDEFFTPASTFETLKEVAPKE
jgi:hypothetical protein